MRTRFKFGVSRCSKWVPGTGFEDLLELIAVEWETMTCSGKLGTHLAVSHTLLEGRAIRSSDVTKYAS